MDEAALANSVFATRTATDPGPNQPFSPTRRARFENAIPTIPSATSEQLLAIDAMNRGSYPFAVSSVPQNDEDADAVFDELGEFGLFLEENWADLL
jgi:hypothetical protein